MRPDVRQACRLCLVTDEAAAGSRGVLAVVAEAVAGGVTMVQFRDKRRSTREALAAASALRDLLRPLGIPLVINDRVDIALAVGADGVHVGQDDMPVAVVRALVGPAMIVGLSITRDADLARPDAADADYLGLGPIFAQTTKEDAAPPLGLDGLGRLRARTDQILVAIGGVGPGNAASLIAAGADGFAVVSAVMAAADPRLEARRLGQILADSRSVSRRQD